MGLSSGTVRFCLYSAGGGGGGGSMVNEVSGSGQGFSAESEGLLLLSRPRRCGSVVSTGQKRIPIGQLRGGGGGALGVVV